MSSLTVYPSYKFYNGASPFTIRTLQEGDEVFDYNTQSFLPVKQNLIGTDCYSPVRVKTCDDCETEPTFFYFLEWWDEPASYMVFNSYPDFCLKLGRLVYEGFNPVFKAFE